MSDRTEPVILECKGHHLIGLLHRADRPTGKVLIILVGGPQYRVGAHRQYVHLARDAASRGIDVLRFDYPGLGDSEGTFPGFEDVGDEIANAVAFARDRLPHAAEIYLWGLCESASSAMIFAPGLHDVAGIVAVNPWAENPRTKSRTLLRHYYLSRLADRQFWHDLFKGQVAIGSALTALGSNLKTAVGIGRQQPATESNRGDAASMQDEDFRLRMARGLLAFSGHTLILLSENDLTAREFDQFTRSNRLWRKVYRKIAGRLERRHCKGCDHTFSSQERRNRLAAETINWILGK